MLVTLDVTAPWDVPLGLAQYELVFYSLMVAGLALFAQFVRTGVSLNEVASRYRPALYASMCICGVAFLSYVYLAVKFDTGYDLQDGVYVPNAESFGSYLPRYMDWSVTVPLLIVEALAVSTLIGARAARTRFIGMACAFLMIFTGYLDAGVIGHGTSSSAMLVWGIISTVFFAVLYVVLLGVLRRSKESMSAEVYTANFKGDHSAGVGVGLVPDRVRDPQLDLRQRRHHGHPGRVLLRRHRRENRLRGDVAQDREAPHRRGRERRRGEPPRGRVDLLGEVLRRCPARPEGPADRPARVAAATGRTERASLRAAPAVARGPTPTATVAICWSGSPACA